MKRMGKLTALSLIAVSLFYAKCCYAQSTNILYIIDSSGSMAKELNGTKQIDAAKNALVSGLLKVPSSTKVALRIYGHRVSQNDKELSCKDSALSFKTV